jgi:hypothetical protein
METEIQSLITGISDSFFGLLSDMYNNNMDPNNETSGDYVIYALVKENICTICG